MKLTGLAVALADAANEASRMPSGLKVLMIVWIAVLAVPLLIIIISGYVKAPRTRRSSFMRRAIVC